MAENTDYEALFSDFSGSYTPPETIKREEDEEETDLFSEFSGSYIGSEPAIQEEPENSENKSVFSSSSSRFIVSGVV